MNSVVAALVQERDDGGWDEDGNSGRILGIFGKQNKKKNLLPI